MVRRRICDAPEADANRMYNNERSVIDPIVSKGVRFGARRRRRNAFSQYLVGRRFLKCSLPSAPYGWFVGEAEEVVNAASECRVTEANGAACVCPGDAFSQKESWVNSLMVYACVPSER